MKYSICPNCKKKGYYEALALDVGDCIEFGNKGTAMRCKYCNPRRITKKEKLEFEKEIKKELSR